MRGRKPFPLPDISILRAEYESGSSTISLGRKYGCDATTISRALARAGVKCRSRARLKGSRNARPFASGFDEIMRMRGEGKSGREIASALGCSYQNVYQILQRWQGRP